MTPLHSSSMRLVGRRFDSVAAHQLLGAQCEFESSHQIRAVRRKLSLLRLGGVRPSSVKRFPVWRTNGWAKGMLLGERRGAVLPHANRNDCSVALTLVAQQ